VTEDGPVVPGGASLRIRPGVFALAVLVVFTVDGLLRFGYFYLGSVAAEAGVPAPAVLIDELTGSYASGLLFFGLVLFTLRFRIRRDGWARRLPLYGAALLVYSVVKTTLMWGSRSALYPLAGLGAYDYGRMAFRYPMEFFNDVPWFVITVGGVHAWLFYRDVRDRDVRTARLEARLADARLAGLQRQLRPHFLFNTLNTVSSVMYRSRDAADRILTRLGDLLRLSMAEPGRQEVALADEVDAVGLYLDIVRARFEDRLDVETSVDPDARDARVPRFLLQPLVENAVKHGLGRAADAGWIRIAAERDGDRLRLTVEDDGPGLRISPDEAVGKGIGLSNLVERLELLHGEAASLRLESRRPRGVRVVVETPYRPAEEAVDGGTGDGTAAAGGSGPGSRQGREAARA